MTTTSQPPGDSLQPFRQLAQDLREASANRDHATAGRLVVEHLQPETVSVMLYVTTPLGYLTIIGAYVQLWEPLAPEVLNREPSLDDMAIVLRAAARR